MGLFDPIKIGFDDIFGSDSTNTTTGGGQSVVEGAQGKYTSVTNNGKNTINSGGVDTQSDSGQTNSTSSKVVNSGRTDVQQLMLSDQAVDGLVRKILEGTQGLTAVTTGEKIAGVYGATATTMLANDLISRTAAEVEAKRAANVTTVGSSTTDTNNTEDIGARIVANVQGPRSVVEGPSSILTREDITPKVSTVTKADTQTEQEKNGLLNWIICTELNRQNRMGNRQYLFGTKKFREYSPTLLRGYYIWAVPATIHLKKYPHSLFSSFLDTWFNARANHILTLNNQFLREEKKSILNPISYYSTHAIVWILSKTIARKYTANFDILNSVIPSRG